MQTCPMVTIGKLNRKDSKKHVLHIFALALFHPKGILGYYVKRLRTLLSSRRDNCLKTERHGIKFGVTEEAKKRKILARGCEDKTLPSAFNGRGHWVAFKRFLTALLLHSSFPVM